MTGAPFYSSFGALFERENDELGIAFIMQGSQFRGLQGYFGRSGVKITFFVSDTLPKFVKKTTYCEVCGRPI